MILSLTNKVNEFIFAIILKSAQNSPILPRLFQSLYFHKYRMRHKSQVNEKNVFYKFLY